MRRPAAIVVSLLTLSTALAACGGRGGSSSPVDQAAAVRAVEGLCELRDVNNRDPADAMFLDQVHAFLHELAAALIDEHPEESAALLEAKQIVEQDLQGTELPNRWSQDVDALLGRTRAGLDLLDVGAPQC